MKKLLATLMCTCLLHAGFSFYNPQMGRWMTRDPIEERGGENLYAFCANNPTSNIDPNGMFTLGDAEDSLSKRGVGREIRTWHGDEYSDRQLFEEWLRLERSRGAWWTNLPRCPSKLCIKKDGTPANPDSSKWKDPSRGGRILSRYHPGGVFEMRSLPVDGHGNQCVYDEKGNVLIGPSAGGTVDWGSPGWVSYLWRHGPHDVNTYELAEKINRIPDYYSVRPSW